MTNENKFVYFWVKVDKNKSSTNSFSGNITNDIFQLSNFNYSINSIINESTTGTNYQALETNLDNSTYYFGIKDEFIFSRYTKKSTGFADIITNDMFIAVEQNSNEVITFNCKYIANTHRALEVYKDGNLYTMAFIDITNNKFYTNVQFNFTAGTTVSDPTSVFDVIIDGQTLYTVNNYNITQY